MAFSSAVLHEIERDIAFCRRRPAPDPSRTSFWGRTSGYIPTHGLAIEALALGGEQPAALRDRLERAYDAYEPDTPGAVALVEQVVTATLEIERIRRLEATVRAEKLRTAELRWEHAQD